MAQVSGAKAHDSGTRRDEAQDWEDREKKALLYWFLLEDEMVQAITKGNKSLITLALKRIEYLSKKIQPDLLKEGLQGEEEALWDIHRFLHNNGWWERARNLPLNNDSELGKLDSPDQTLLDFLQANKKFIHPNVQEMVKKGSKEGLQMALNHIHYGSLQARRNSRNGGLGNNFPSPDKLRYLKSVKVKNGQHSGARKHHAILQDFIKGFKHLIEPSVYKDAWDGNDKALSLALGQIHHHSLTDNREEKYSYKDSLLSRNKAPTVRLSKSPTEDNLKKGPTLTKNKIFFTGFEDNCTLKDL